MVKNLLKESVVRRWGSLAKISPLTENYIEENAEQFNEKEEVKEGEEALEEDNFDKTGRGPHREGAGKTGEHQGIASNQGQEPKKTPDGKLEIPGTNYASDHKNTSKSPDKGSTDGGAQLQGKGNVTEQRLNEMPMPGEEEELGGADMGPPMGDEMEPPVGGGEVDVESLVSAIVGAISQQTGVEISVAGHAEPDGDEMGPPMGDEMPPQGAEPPAEMDMGPPDEDYEEEEVVEDKFGLSEVDDAEFQKEAYNRGYKYGDDQKHSDYMQEVKTQEEGKMAEQDAMVESIAKRVAMKLRKKPAPRKAKK